MAALQCDICGGKLMGRPGGIFECDSCGMEYDTAWAKAKIQEIKGTVKVEGTVEVQGTVKVDGSVKVEGSVTLESLLKRGQLALEDGDWNKAEEYCDKALDINPECAEAYLGKLMAQLKVSQKQELKDSTVPFEDNANYQKAIRFADKEFKRELTSYEEACRKLQEEGPAFEIEDGVLECYYGEEKTVKIPGEVKEIGSFVFRNCKIVSVTIPNSVKTIGEEAFANCERLTAVTIPSSVEKMEGRVFQNCSNLTSVTFAGNTHIESNTFSGCDKLSNIKLPQNHPHYRFAGNCLIDTMDRKVLFGNGLSKIPADGRVTTIGSGAFADCRNLTSITIPEGIEKIEWDAFARCSSLTSITISKNVKYIGDGAFSGCDNLTTITIPDSTIQIGVEEFKACKNLKELLQSRTIAGNPGELIPKGTREIESKAFVACEALTNVVIPDSVESIWSGAFLNCVNLTSVTIPGSVRFLGRDAFYGCEKLAAITIPEGIRVLNDATFCHCKSLTSVTLPSTLERIGVRTFSCCGSLASITIPNGVTEIGRNAFYGCESLTSIVIPGSVKHITTETFYNCRNLKTVAIRDGVSEIWGLAFRDCTNLRSVTIPESVKEISDDAFSGCGNFVIHTMPGSMAETWARSKGIPVEEPEAVQLTRRKTELQREVQTLQEQIAQAAEKLEKCSGIFAGIQRTTINKQLSGFGEDLAYTEKLLADVEKELKLHTA